LTFTETSGLDLIIRVFQDMIKFKNVTKQFYVKFTWRR